MTPEQIYESLNEQFEHLSEADDHITNLRGLLTDDEKRREIALLCVHSVLTENGETRPGIILTGTFPTLITNLLNAGVSEDKFARFLIALHDVLRKQGLTTIEGWHRARAQQSIEFSLP